MINQQLQQFLYFLLPFLHTVNGFLIPVTPIATFILCMGTLIGEADFKTSKIPLRISMVTLGISSGELFWSCLSSVLFASAFKANFALFFVACAAGNIAVIAVWYLRHSGVLSLDFPFNYEKAKAITIPMVVEKHKKGVDPAEIKEIIQATTEAEHQVHVGNISVVKEGMAV